ncbi:MAG: AAA family ATPase [Bacteroidales bacterium]|nr:AAA family ATPase [Bacteroidales bacterium]
MSIVEYYLNKQKDINWYNKYTSSADGSSGKIFDHTSTNFRTLDAYISGTDKLEKLNKHRTSEIIDVDNSGQDKYKQHRPAYIRMGFLSTDSLDYCHITETGNVLCKYLVENDLLPNEKWVMVFLLTLKRTRKTGNSDFYIFKTSLRIYMALSPYGYQIEDFFRGLLSIIKCSSLEEMVKEDLFWLVSFYNDPGFVSAYFSSSNEEVREFHDYAVNEVSNDNSKDCIISKFHSTRFTIRSYIDEIKQILCSAILLALQDTGIYNFLMLYSKIFPQCRYENLVRFYEAHKVVFDNVYKDTMNQINIMTGVTDMGIENRLHDVEVALDLVEPDEADMNDDLEVLGDEDEDEFLSDSLPPRGPRADISVPMNIILYGPPGTGKTYSTKEYALSIIENGKLPQNNGDMVGGASVQNRYNSYVDKGRIVFTAFHQSYDYEDFIQGLRPVAGANDNMSFEKTDGLFKQIADTALHDKGRDDENGNRVDNNYVIIIDEINRGNISKIFGELITLIDEPKRWGEPEQLKLKLPSGDFFAVPNNLFIIGTMNSSDKSISLLDAALRRRFYFVEVTPDYNLVKNETYKKVLMRLNDKLKEKFNGGTDSLIGHSYFMNDSVELVKILNNSVIPLLYEYCYDNTKKVNEIVGYAIQDTDLEIVDSSVGRISVSKAVNN